MHPLARMSTMSVGYLGEIELGIRSKCVRRGGVQLQRMIVEIGWSTNNAEIQTLAPKSM